MSKKQIALLIGSAFVLLLLGSITGAGIYAKYFAPQYVYLRPEPVSATFSRFDPVDEPTPSNVATPAQPKSLVDEGTSTEFPDFVGPSNIARPAVVHIKSRFDARKDGRSSDFFSNPFRDFFDDDMIEAPQSLASGSGVLISPDGYIATNNHVIEDAASVEVTLFDNRTFEAKIIGTDISTDLALLKIESAALPYLRFGNSDEVRVGQWVLAVGNPMDLTSTVTAGIVSAKGRNIDLLRNDSQFAIESFIQTDAAVNKGNSGGALVNAKGELVGINTAIASRTGYYAGYSFAIPATIARKVMEDLLSYGEVRRGYLGVSIRPVDAQLAEEEGLSVLKGAYITTINDQLGAYAAGLRVGDVIVSVNSIPVNSSSELQEQVSRYRPGDRVKLAVYRGKAQQTYQVELRALQSVTRTALRSTLEYRGSVFRIPTEDELGSLDVKHGVMVEQAGDKMSRNGIQKGFVITEVNGREMHSIEDLEKALLDSSEYITIKGLYSEGMVASYSFNW